VTAERDNLAAVIAGLRELADAITRDSHCSHLGADIRFYTDEAPGDVLREHDAKVAAAAVEEYADALSENESAAVWDHADFVHDARDWASETLRRPPVPAALREGSS